MLEEYMKTLSAVKKMKPQEEKEYWRQYKEEGSEEARQKIIENYQLLVCREAMRYPVQEMVLLDLIQEGMVGLMEAADGYRPELGVAFSLYAVHRVRGRMLDFLKRTGNELPYETEAMEDPDTFAAMVTPDLAFEAADRNLLHREVTRAMERLPAREQDVIRKVFLEEQTAAETADTLAVSTAYVYRLEKRGIRRLRGMLSRLMHERKGNSD